jgi:hypothetical protein
MVRPPAKQPKRINRMPERIKKNQKESKRAKKNQHNACEKRMEELELGLG